MTGGKSVQHIIEQGMAEVIKLFLTDIRKMREMRKTRMGYRPCSRQPQRNRRFLVRQR